MREARLLSCESRGGRTLKEKSDLKDVDGPAAAPGITLPGVTPLVWLLLVVTPTVELVYGEVGLGEELDVGSDED